MQRENKWQDRWKDTIEYFFKYQSVNHYPEDRNKLINELEPVIQSEIDRAVAEERERCKKEMDELYSALTDMSKNR